MQPYNREEERARFLEEVARLKSKGAFLRDTDFCTSLGVAKNFLSDMRNPERGKFVWVTTKLLHNAYYLYKLDYKYVLLGIRSKPAPDLPPLEELDNRGKLGPPTRRKRVSEE